MTPRDRVLNALEGQPARPVPWIEHGLSEQLVAAAYGVEFAPPAEPRGSLGYDLEEIRRRIRMNELTGVGCLMLPYHYTMAPRIWKKGGFNGALTDRASLKDLVFVELTAQHWDNIKRLVDAKRDYAMYAPITSGIGHIWQTMDLMAFATAVAEDPDLLRIILERYTEWTQQVVEHSNLIGVDYFWCFDDCAFKTGLVYSPQILREIVLPYARRVAAAIRRPWIWHSDGNYMQALDELAALGMNALNPLEPGCLDLDRIRADYPQLTLVGGIDVDVLARGTTDQTRAAVRECFRRLNRGHRYIAASSNSIPDYCRPENLRAMAEQIAVCGSGDNQ
ncbi:MAG: hypothetical protein HY360_05380 [Verrucomicrobia bacterium]|nr:hypothetical protein [Verrucomicrobiota bacterium]